MKLTENFSLDEFNSKDGAIMPPHVLSNVLKLAQNLQVLRNELGQRITINSGYRSPSHNKAVKGKPQSTHLTGMGADIVVNAVDPFDVAATIERLISEGKMEQGGLKPYPTFTHYDIRGTKARW